MTETAETRFAGNFAAELGSFFGLCVWNLVFGALALAFGLQFIVTAITAMAGSGSFEMFPLLQALLGWAGMVIGFRWIVSTTRILKGVNGIRREYRAMERSGPISGEALTGLIIRMMANYRENWTTIWRMNLIAFLGGAIYLALGVVNLFQGISFLAQAGPLYPSLLQAGAANWPAWSVIFALFGAAIDLAIGLASLLFSSWFRRYSRAWDLRLLEAGHADENLRKSMEQG